eukprot:s1407_g1.t4
MFGGGPPGGGLSGLFGDLGGDRPPGGSPFAAASFGRSPPPSQEGSEGSDDPGSEEFGNMEREREELDIEFREAQDKWSKSWIFDQDLCDAVALVGPARHRVPFIRAPLAAISKPLKAALYGDFREGHTRELILEDVTLDAFDVMMRSAYHLELELTHRRALYAFTAARLYMIDDLQKYCLGYLLFWSGFLDCITSLELLTESLKFSLDLPVEIRHLFCRKILGGSECIIESPSFLETHGSIIASLIKLDEFHVSEARLWDRLMEWSAAAVQKPELLGPFADVTSCTAPKRAKSTTHDSNSIGPSKVALQEAVFRLMLPHIRFTQLPRLFFIDKVRKHLDREQSDAVMDYFLVGRDPQGVLPKPRSSLQCLQQHASWGRELLMHNTDESRGCMGESQAILDMGGRVEVTAVRVNFFLLGKGVSLTWLVSLAGTKSEKKSVELCGTCTSTIPVLFENVCSELVLEFSSESEFLVQSIHVYGKRMFPELERANEAGVKARARRGKKSKASKEKTGESPTPAPMKEETKEEPREVAAERKKAGKKGTESSPAVPAANRSAEVLQDKSTRDALLQALNSVSAPGANDIPVVPPSDPEIHRLVSQGRALLQVDGKKAVVLLRLAARKGYLPAYLLLAEHAQSSQDDTLLIESLCALFTSPDVHKQLPKNVLNTIVMQLTAVLRDPKNRREAEAHAADIDAIAKDWPILHMLKFPPGESKSKTSTAKQQAASKSQAKAVSQDFQKIKSAMASNPPDPPAPVKEALITEIPSPLSGSCKRKEVGFQSVPGSWRQENGRWCISIQANRDDLSTAKLDISHRDLRLTGPDGCWFPSKGRPSTSLKALSFEALLVLPADAIAETLRADLGEAECSVHEVSLPGDGDGLQEAWHQVYTDRCVAQEQSCLLLPGDRAEAFRWLSAMTNWFLGTLAVGFTISGISSNLRLESCQGREPVSRRLLAKVETPQDLELSQVEASWSKKNHCLEVAGPSVKKVQETPLSPFVDQLD